MEKSTLPTPSIHHRFYVFPINRYSVIVNCVSHFVALHKSRWIITCTRVIIARIPSKSSGLAAWKQRHVADNYHSVLLSLTTLFGYRSFRAKLCEYSRSFYRPDGIRVLGESASEIYNQSEITMSEHGQLSSLSPLHREKEADCNFFSFLFFFVIPWNLVSVKISSIIFGEFF